MESLRGYWALFIPDPFPLRQDRPPPWRSYGVTLFEDLEDIIIQAFVYAVPALRAVEVGGTRDFTFRTVEHFRDVKEEMK